MVSMEAVVGVLVIVGATAYWLLSSEALERLVAMATGQRALALGGFMGGLMWGNLVIKAVVGFVGGFGVLAVSDLIDISPMQFGAIIALIIIGLAVTRGDDGE